MLSRFTQVGSCLWHDSFIGRVSRLGGLSFLVFGVVR